MKTITKVLIGVFLCSLFACIGGSTINNTPTSGRTTIGADESYQLLMQAQTELFEAIYHYAIVDAKYAPEVDIVDLFMKDSIQVMVLSRKLTETEEKILLNNKFVPKTTKIAYDALAFIVNKKNPDSSLRFDQIKNIFGGKVKSWEQINPKSELGNLDVIFDNNKSGNPRYIREKFNITGKLPDYCYAVNSNEEVIKFVEKNPQALGIISVNWISDKDDTTSNNFIHAIKVVGIGSEGDTQGVGHFYRPYQGYIAEGSYPFCREVYIINRETFTGLGTGFAQFVAGEKGQRVILKAGLVPATMPVRLIQFKK
jgi:phosphate transport system substrate-binding protein